MAFLRLLGIDDDEASLEPRPVFLEGPRLDRTGRGDPVADRLVRGLRILRRPCRRPTPPKTQSRPWMGREKRNGLSAQRIIFGKVREPRTRGTAALRISAVGVPLALRLKPRYSPRGVVMASSRLSSTPWDLAKPFPAGVRAPSGPLAMARGGPVTVSSRSSWPSERSAVTMRRRGVAKALRERTSIRPSRSSLRKPASICSRAERIWEAGSSSVRSSRRNSIRRPPSPPCISGRCR